MGKIWEDTHKERMAKLICAKCGKKATWEIQYLDKIVYACKKHLGTLIVGYSIVKPVDKREYK